MCGYRPIVASLIVMACWLSVAAGQEVWHDRTKEYVPARPPTQTDAAAPSSGGVGIERGVSAPEQGCSLAGRRAIAPGTAGRGDRRKSLRGRLNQAEERGGSDAVA